MIWMVLVLQLGFPARTPWRRARQLCGAATFIGTLLGKIGSMIIVLSIMFSLVQGASVPGQANLRHHISEQLRKIHRRPRDCKG